MNRDKKILYTISFGIFAVLLLVLLINLEEKRIVTACLLAVLTPVVCLTIKKRNTISIHKKEVLLLTTIIAVLYVIFVQMFGIYFGSYENPYFVTTEMFLWTVLPMLVVIVTTEILRYVLLAQKNKVVSVIAFLFCVLAEVLAFANLSDLSSVNKLMDLIALTVFPAISANVFYHYSSKRFGIFPNISFRIISTLYIYFVPSITGMSDALFACSKIFLPIILLAMISAMYEKKVKKAVRKNKKLSAISMILSCSVIICIAMLISCQFRFGAIVIATGSMTGEINKGDVIIYERYEDQSIAEGQVIVFSQGPSKIVHRVIKIERIGAETRYYTKGDANPAMDEGYITKTDIVGLTDIKVSFVGYPTLWLHELINPTT